jgi:hypothetical protein
MRRSRLSNLYKGEPLDKKYQPDYVCYGEVIVEIKAIAGLSVPAWGTSVNNQITFCNSYRRQVRGRGGNG